MGDTKPAYGYADYESDGNPFSNKIILMDEVHNLVNPSDDILKDARRVEMLDRLKLMLRTATNSVLVGFTATPLVETDDGQWSYRPLLDIIKGDDNANASDEGFVSYFMAAPSPVFPKVIPDGVPAKIPKKLIHKFELKNWPVPGVVEDDCHAQLDDDQSSGEHSSEDLEMKQPIGKKTKAKSNRKAKRSVRPKTPKGNLAAYEKETDTEKRAELCSLLQPRVNITTIENTFSILTGEAGTIKGTMLSCDHWQRLEGFSTKLFHVCQQIRAGHKLKTLVLVHDRHGFKLLAMLLAEYFGREVCAYWGGNETDSNKWKGKGIVKNLIGCKHDPKALATAEGCKCNLCSFNSKSNLKGTKLRIMVADAKFCSEGVSFFGVRELHLVDIPPSVSLYLQRVGRAVRFNGHAGLPLDECNVHVHLYCATLPGTPPEESQDEENVRQLIGQVGAYHKALFALQNIAVDHGMWNENEGVVCSEPPGCDYDDDGLTEKAVKAMEEQNAEQTKASHAVNEEQRKSLSFAKSNYKSTLDKLTNTKPTSEDVWSATKTIVESYAIDSYDVESYMRAMETFVEAQSDDDPTFQHDKARHLSMLLWTSLEKVPGLGKELCSLLNRCFREDKQGPVLKAGLQFRRALNLSVVKLARDGMHVNWPCGPDGEGQTQSTAAHLTYRGAGMPQEHLEFYLDRAKGSIQEKRIRTQHYVSSTFDRDTAVTFMASRGGSSPVLWVFKFSPDQRCDHVAFLNRSEVKSEREFLLEPYTVLTVLEVYESAGEDGPHTVIVVKVAENNREHPNDLPLAPWI